MGLDDINFGVESDCSCESCEDRVRYGYGSDGSRNRVGVHKIWNNPWRRWHPSDHNRLDGSRCRAHVLG